MPAEELIQVLQQKQETLKRLKAQTEGIEREIETLRAAIRILEQSTGPVPVVTNAGFAAEGSTSEKSHEGVPHAPVPGNIRKAFP